MSLLRHDTCALIGVITCMTYNHSTLSIARSLGQSFDRWTIHACTNHSTLVLACTLFIATILVHVCTMSIMHACTMITVHACTMIIVHACAMNIVLASTMIIVHACTMIIVHACIMIIAHACTMIMVCACTMIVVYLDERSNDRANDPAIARSSDRAND